MKYNDADYSRQVYVQRKESIIELLDRVIEFYVNEEDSLKADTFITLKNNLINGEFSIVVVGEFSAGKSTLLNALMGKRILPSFSNETTATVNFLRHKDKAVDGEAGRVFYKNGEPKKLETVTLDEVKRYVSTKGDDVVNSVEYLDLYLDSDFLRDGVTLVDSPGLNGVLDGHREITEKQILKSHASIFMFSSDHPGSKTDFEFLHNLRQKVKTIIFVLNKIDHIKEYEGDTVEDIIETLKNSYKKKFPEETTVPEIWPVSASLALEARTQENKEGLEEKSRLKDFENRLMTFLTCGEKAHQQLMAPIEKVIAVSREEKQLCTEEIKLLNNMVDTEELERQVIGIQEIVDNLSGRMNDSRKSVSEQVVGVLGEVIEELNSNISKLQIRKLKEIDEFEDLDELLIYLEGFEKMYTHSVYSLTLQGEESLKDKIMSVVKMQFFNEADIIEERINLECSEINFDIHSHLDTEQKMFEVGLKEMDEKTKQLEEELRALKMEATKAEEDFYNARAVERKREKIEIEIQNLRDSKDTIATQMLPPIEQYTEEVHKKQYRGGILGVIGWLLLGGKNVTQHELRRDSTEHDNAKKAREEAIAKKDAEIEEKRMVLESYADVDSSILELKQIRKLSEVEETSQRLERLQRENIEKINEKYNKEIKRCKRNLSSYCDEVSDELLRQVKKELRKSEQSYINTVIEVVEANIREEMNEKLSRIAKLQEQMKTSELEKNNRINMLNAKIESIDKLIETAINLQVELENETIDTIEQVEI